MGMKDPRIKFKWQKTLPDWSDDFRVMVPIETLAPYPDWLARSSELQIMRILPAAYSKHGFRGAQWDWCVSAAHMILPPGVGRGIEPTAVEAALAAEEAWLQFWGDRPVPAEWLR